MCVSVCLLEADLKVSSKPWLRALDVNLESGVNHSVSLGLVLPSCQTDLFIHSINTEPSHVLGLVWGRHSNFVR